MGQESRRRLRGRHCRPLRLLFSREEATLAVASADMRIGGAKTLESVPRPKADLTAQLSTIPADVSCEPPSERRGQRDLITIPMSRVPSVRTPVPIK